jgi:hypothetical protein
VTTNLELTLHFIRLEEEERIIWIDALCISQVDLPEKNHQVGQMRQVYVTAEMTLVWLGEEADGQVAIDYCRSLDEMIETTQMGDVRPVGQGLVFNRPTFRSEARVKHHHLR